VHAREIRLAPPDNATKVVQEYLEIHNNSTLPAKDYEYKCIVFSEGSLEFSAKLGYDLQRYVED